MTSGHTLTYAVVFGLLGCNAEPGLECALEAGAEPDFADQLGCLDDFGALASRPLDLSIPGARSLKTVVDRADEERLYFTNSNLYSRHYEFASDWLSRDGLPPVPDVSQFNAAEYYSPDRRFLLGAVTLYEQLEVWTYELSPYDIASPSMVETAFSKIAAQAYFGDDLYFHPTSAAQESLAADLPESIKVITTEELTGGSPYQAMNLGESYGQLRFFSAADLEQVYVGPRDIVVLDAVPNDLSVVAGLITSTVQTPLAHVNVLSEQRGTPNMVLLGASDDKDLQSMANGWARLVVGAFEYTLEPATQAEADAWWEAHQPTPTQVPALDFEVTDLRDIEEIGVEDVAAFGGKASNFGVISRLGEDVPHPKAFAVPVFYYKQFEQQNGFDVRVAELQADPMFASDPLYREQALLDLQAEIQGAPIDPAFEALLLEKLAADYPGLRMRFRSSTNAEDLDGFSGAGLYSSSSGEIEDPTSTVPDAVRSTWASLWNFRAYEERSYAGIPQDAVSMALLVHPASGAEAANGVALTNNLFDATEPAFFINAQFGESSVTSPAVGSTADSLLYFFGSPVEFVGGSRAIA